MWLDEAEKYDVLPLNDLGVFELRALEYHVAIRASGRYTYYPGTTEVPEASAATTTNVSHRILAEVQFTPDSEGVIVAQGTRFGGYTLFVKDGELTYVYHFLAIPPSRASSPTRPRRARTSWASSSREIRGVASRYGLAGEGFCIGFDGGDAVSTEYSPRTGSPAAGSSGSSSTSAMTPT